MDALPLLLACFQQIPIENVKNSPVRCFFRKTKKVHSRCPKAKTVYLIL